MMKILGMGIPELAIILGVVLLIFGPKQLPKLGSAIGKTMKSLREGVAEGTEAEEEEAEVLAIEEVDGEEAAPVQKKTVKKTTVKKAAPKKAVKTEA